MGGQSHSSLVLLVSLLTSLTSLLLPGAAAADTWLVPDQLATIQAGVDSAASGDTVLVGPGTYIESILVIGKAVHISSSNGPEATVIDGSSPSRPDTSSAICAIGADGLVIEGFTIENGSGGSTLGQESYPSSGGGICLFASGGVVRDCIIRSNSCDGRGGGIYLYVSTLTTIEECTITGNESLAGGGIGAERCSPVIQDCVVSENLGLSGSGIYLIESATIMRRLLIAGNRNAGGASGFGGGIWAGGGSPTIESCTVVENSNRTGGGIYFLLSPAPLISQSIVAFNQQGSAVACNGSMPSIECSDLFGNEAGDELCGIDLGDNFQLDPRLCKDYSIAENSPCAPAQSPGECGLVGAYDVGCVIAVAPTTWGRIKNAYRSP